MKLIGKSGQIQTVLDHKLAKLREAHANRIVLPVRERRWLFTGPPGCGKTHLAKECALRLAGNDTPFESAEQVNAALLREAFGIEHRNGSNVSVDVVRDWYRNMPYPPMNGGIAVKFVDEVDAIIGAPALNDLRTYLDELAHFRVFIACTNLAPDKLQPQLQSRFQIFHFAPIPAELIAGHLVAKFSLDLATARAIAFEVKGDVRAAETDAQSHLDCQAAFKVAA